MIQSLLSANSSYDRLVHLFRGAFNCVLNAALFLPPIHAVHVSKLFADFSRGSIDAPLKFDYIRLQSKIEVGIADRALDLREFVLHSFYFDGAMHDERGFDHDLLYCLCSGLLSNGRIALKDKPGRREG